VDSLPSLRSPGMTEKKRLAGNDGKKEARRE